MRLVKRIMALLMVALSMVNVSACHLMDDRVPKTKIIEFVNKNQPKLSAFVEKYSDPNQEDFQKEFGATGVVKSVFKNRNNIIDFSCGEKGLATNSTYVGFYFSADNTLISPLFDDIVFTEISDGVYEWQDEKGLHKSHIERICDNWFYYDEMCH